MTAIPILNGVYADTSANIRSAYPRNLEPRLVDSGLSKGYLRAAPGLTEVTTGPGSDRGAINWLGDCYRAMGGNLVVVSGAVATTLGAITDGDPTSMDYSFDRLAIASGGDLFYYNATEGVTQVTDPDLGLVLDMIWISGFFMTTDGTSLVVTELNDPYAVNPLKYGSSESDPDPITGLMKVRGEAYAVNRYTIENFQNIGGNGFPFQVNNGGLVSKGCVGTHAKAYFLETFAFVGGGRNEAISVYLAGSGQAISLSTPEVDRELAALSDAEQAGIEMESVVLDDEQKLLIHLPDKTLVYNHQATSAAGEPIWHILAGGVLADEQYPARHFALAGGRWLCGTADGVVGYLDQSVETHFGAVAGWRFETAFIYNASKGAILNSLELVGLPGHAPFGVDPTCFLSVTQDGMTWGQERAISMGGFGERRKRVQWRPKRRFANYCGLRFRGANTSMASWARLEAVIEPLNA